MPAASEVTIQVASARDIEAVRELWNEYWRSLGFSPEFQNFTEECRGLPGAYASPRGRLLIAFVRREPAGTAALRPLSENACEGKRLYVRPRYRGMSVGSTLVERLIEEARLAGYRKMYGDTLESMKSAMRLYRQLGFREVEPYSPDPTPGAIYLELPL